MSGALTSRSELYSDGEQSDRELILPELEFEIVEAAVEQDEPMEEEEFDFPLFSFGTAHSETKQEEPTLVKVTLNDAAPAYFTSKRPEAYYFSQYTPIQREQFQRAAITADTIIRTSPTIINPSSKVFHLAKYNARVQRDLDSLRKKTTRPGKQARMARLEAKKGIQRRKNYQKKLDNEELLKVMKKIKRTRGGKKHKKKKGIVEETAQ